MGGVLTACPDAPHPGERGRVSGGPVDGEVGTMDSGGDAPASRATVDPRRIARREKGVKRVKKGGGDATGLQPSTDGASKAGEPTALRSVPAATRSTNDEGLGLGLGWVASSLRAAANRDEIRVLKHPNSTPKPQIHELGLGPIEAFELGFDLCY